MPGRFVFWDFDGTLGYCDGMWSGTLAEIMQDAEPGAGVTRDDFRPLISRIFPWDRPDEPHPEIQDSESWWQLLTPDFIRAFEAQGLSSTRATELAAEFPARYCAPEKWHLFDDTLATLEVLSEEGWKHVIVSNHVPELVSIVDSLGIKHFFEQIHSSAITGYEKPNPEAFNIALRAIPENATIWMVGDNPEADVAGAESVGIPAILVRNSEAAASYQCAALKEVAEMLSGE